MCKHDAGTYQNVYKVLVLGYVQSSSRYEDMRKRVSMNQSVSADFLLVRYQGRPRYQHAQQVQLRDQRVPRTERQAQQAAIGIATAWREVCVEEQRLDRLDGERELERESWREWELVGVSAGYSDSVARTSLCSAQRIGGRRSARGLQWAQSAREQARRKH